MNVAKTIAKYITVKTYDHTIRQHIFYPYEICSNKEWYKPIVNSKFIGFNTPPTIPIECIELNLIDFKVNHSIFPTIWISNMKRSLIVIDHYINPYNITEEGLDLLYRNLRIVNYKNNKKDLYIRWCNEEYLTVEVSLLKINKKSYYIDTTFQEYLTKLESV